MVCPLPSMMMSSAPMLKQVEVIGDSIDPMSELSVYVPEVARVPHDEIVDGVTGHVPPG